LVFGMPQAAIKLDAARIVLSLDEIAHYLLDRSARVPA
jgi:chemotaxis response regulator CheB